MVEKRANALVKSKRRRIWKRIVSVLGCLVVFCTVYALVLPAVTKTQETYCGLEGHTHGNACYQEQLTCGLEERQDSVIYGHAHSSSCYQEEQSLLCTLEETEDVLDENGEVVQPGHVHDQSCYEVTKVLVCEKAESADKVIKGHTHSSSCYKSVMTCQKMEHAHVSACYSNPKADLETYEDWEKTLPKEKEMTEEWEEDVLLVADSQLGYTESQANYVVDEAAGYNRGYTRYGHWYGDAYGDWCAMFVSFCLHYANVDEEYMPRDANCQNWINTLKKDEWDLWRPVAVDKKEKAEKYNPQPGDLVFFNWDTDNDVADHIGFVYEVVEATEEEPAKLKTIEGNSSDRVEYVVYELDDPFIMGYAELPENPEPSKAEREAAKKAASAGADAKAVFLDQIDGAGDYVHLSSHPYYQSSAEVLSGQSVHAFALVPSDAYDAQTAWVPSVTEWSAKAEANYLVALCADGSEKFSLDGASYDVVPLDDTCFSSAEAQSQLLGVIAHGYPFLTYEEMHDQLASAYKDGELAVDVSGCSESELLAATQAAVWQIANPNQEWQEFKHDALSDDAAALTINPLSHADLTHVSEAETSEHCQAIAEWLLSQSAFQDLQVSSCEYDVQKNEYDLYTLTVNARFNRAIEPGEIVDMRLTAGSSSADSMRLSAGDEGFSAALDGLTQEEVSAAFVSLNVSGEKMHVRYFCNAQHQDMVGGQWENYSQDLSFSATEGSMSVSVSKQWAQDELADGSVMMKLFANGVQVGEEVELSAKNGWAYAWGNLGEYDCLGNAIEYTVQEVPVPGYYSSVSTVEGSKAVLPSDVNFVITNTKVDEGANLVDVVVKKEWEGRQDEDYPSKATVQLLQNEEPYGDPVDLSAENEWLASWSDLPRTDNDGNAFEYAVAENPVEGYESTQESSFQDGTWTIDLVNTWNPKEALVVLQNVDANNPAVLLPGAEFDLYLVTSNEEDPVIPGAADVRGVKQEPVATGATGRVEMALNAGEVYYLVETKAPAGYSLLDTPVGFSVSVEGSLVAVSLLDGSAWAAAESGSPAVLTVKSGAGFALPETGGTGSAPFPMAGLVFVFAGIVLLVLRRRREREGLRHPL